MNIDEFIEAKVDNLPDVHSLSDPLTASLWVLLVAKTETSSVYLSAAEISTILRDAFGINLHWRTIGSVLAKESTLVSRRQRRGRIQFQIMTPGEDLVHAAPSDAYLVDPKKAFTATRQLHEILGSLRGTVRLCDPYADTTSLDHLAAVPQANPINWLTSRIHNKSVFRQQAASFSAQHSPLEIRMLARGILHDRYVIDDSSMYVLGTSLNGFGKSQSFIVLMGEDIRSSMISTFDGLWSGANLFT